MNRRVLLLIIGLLFLPLGCGGPTGLEPSEFCGDHSDAAIATFEDANLTAAIRAALVVGPQEQLTCGRVSGLTQLDARWSEITSLVGIQNLTSPTLLRLGSNFSISDIGSLSGLTSLTELDLTSNSIGDIDALSGLTSLTILDLTNNPNLTNIQPLLDNTGLGAGDHVLLRSTYVSCTDVVALQDKDVSVFSDCP